MPKAAPLHWYDTLQRKILSPIDNVIATPFNNEQFIWDLEGQNTIRPGPPDTAHPYPNINDSPNAALLRGGVFLAAVLGIVFSAFIAFYKKLRRQEGASHYFFFERLFYLVGIDKFKDAFGNCPVPYRYLWAAAYFYNPDIPAFVLWVRRTWAFLTRNNAFKRLEKYLNSKNMNKTKKVLLEEIYEKINEKLALFITKQKKYGDWYIEQRQDRKWLIKPSEGYFEVWQNRMLKQKKESSNSTDLNEEKTFFSYVFDFLESRLGELARASFVYWVGVFTFYFLPGIGIAASGIVWPPILIAGIFLGGLWIIKGYQIYQAKVGKQLTFDEESKQQAAVEAFTEAVKHQLQLDILITQEIASGALNYAKVKFKESKLCKEIKEVLKEKNDFTIVRAIFNGFIGGCFAIFFSGWLLTSALGLVVTLNPIAVALVTLGLGLAYGIYSATNYYKRDVKALSYIDVKFAKLKESYDDIEIPNISMRACDRLFRRGTSSPTAWTATKQVFKRIWIGFIRFGTGMLFLKLLALGTTTKVLVDGLGLSITILLLPTLIPMLVGGLVFAGWHIWQYHCERKERKTGRIMDFFLNRSYSLDTDRTTISEDPQQSAPRTPDDVFNANERAFNLLSYGSNRFRFPMQNDQRQSEFLTKRLRKLSSSEPHLAVKDIQCKESEILNWANNIVEPENAQQRLGRKRSNTLPSNFYADTLDREHGAGQKTIETLKGFNVLNRRGLFVCEGATGLSSSMNSSNQVGLAY